MTKVKLETLVREWRDAQKAIDKMSVAERRTDMRPLARMIDAHNALLKFAKEELD
jgi:hypothetical protein